jgi:signal peptidase I
VIAFADPLDPKRDLVKRIIGLPGDKIEIREQIVYVNDVPQPRVEQGSGTYEDYSNETRQWSSESCQLYSEQLVRGTVLPPASEEQADLVASYRAAALAGVTEHLVFQCEKAVLGERQGPFSVMPGKVFVLGDNRDRSYDSRSEEGWQVPLDNIKGRGILILWSLGRGGRALLGNEGVRLERLVRRIE